MSEQATLIVTILVCWLAAAIITAWLRRCLGYWEDFTPVSRGTDVVIMFFAWPALLISVCFPLDR